MIEVSDIPLGLYVHVPWCVRKCPYCDFNSHEEPAPPWQRYVDCLLADLVAELPSAADRRIETIFIGGGTPSLMPGPQMAMLLEGIRERIELAPGAEVSIEANPGAVDAARFADYAAAGINRLSLGAQSFRSPQLVALGRIHDPDAIEAAYRAARSAGFDNINLDVMHSLPCDDEAGCRYDLERAIAMQAEHVSWYELTLEAGTAFARKPPKRPRHEDIVDYHETGVAALATGGYTHYEISAFARSGRRCRHNLNYWQFGDYLGIGAGAHGKYSTPEAVFRSEKRRSPRGYMDDFAGSASEALRRRSPRCELVCDFMVNALRLREGFAPALFERRTGLPFSEVEGALEQGVSRGLVEVDARRVRASGLGFRFLNELQLLFVEPGSSA